MAEPYRSSLSITFSVWRALFLREALTRISGGRGRWFWIVAEPLAHMAFLAFVFAEIRHRVIAGIDPYIWIVVGLSAFFIFRRSAVQSMWAIDDNQAMFVYRQVRPVDTVFVRAALDGFLNLLIGLVALGILVMLHHDVVPEQPLLVFSGVFGIWLLGLGFGLIASVPIVLVQETSVFLNFLMLPLYLASGVIFPVAMIPHPYAQWLAYNPLVHALETIRLGFSSSYHVIQGLDMSYVYLWALVSIFFGLVLQLRFAERVVAQ
ncbi:ABC transporter permease [Azonexus sp.]|uniref:ABC transporter permease n=1 Tax=Azonexus sp. TaxID=1872668 RepID=UPI0035B25C1E